MTEKNKGSVIGGMGSGFVVVAIIVVIVARIMGADWLYALIAAVLIGLVVGGGLGLLLGARRFQAGSDT